MNSEAGSTVNMMKTKVMPNGSVACFGSGASSRPTIAVVAMMSEVDDSSMAWQVTSNRILRRFKYPLNSGGKRNDE